jgi:3-oxoacyl-[acyl-carrier protein] reductase
LQAPDLTGRKALVIGAGTQVGRSIALALAGAGADVAVASATLDGNEVMAVRRTRRAIEALGRRSAEYAMDTVLGQNVQVSTRQVTREMGGLDLLINAQVVFLSRPAEKTSDSEWTRTLALGLSAVFYACRAAIREFGERGGSIINVVSPLGERGIANAAASTAAQHGVVGLTRALAAECADRRIRVNAIAAGWPEGAPDYEQPSLKHPLARDEAIGRPGWPDEPGPLAVYLAGPASASVTGQVFSVADGGSV